MVSPQNVTMASMEKGDKMKNHDRTTEQLLTEVKELRQRIASLEASEAELRQLEEKYQDLIEKEKDIIYTLDDKGNVTFASPAVESILGYRPEEVIDKNFMVLIPHELQERTWNDFQNLLKTGEIIAETALLDREGQPHYVEYSSTTIKKEGDRVVGTRGIVRDITERKRAEEELQRYREHLERLIEERTVELKKANEQLQEELTERQHTLETLRESEERFRGIVEGTQAGYFYIDRDGQFQKVNDAWLQMHRYASPDEVIGRHFSLTQAETDLKQAQRNVERLLRGEPIPAGEFTRRCRDGSIGYHTFSATPVVRDGKVIGLEGFLIDITERKRAEETLRASEARFRTLFEAIPEAVLVHDDESTILHINDVGSQRLEWPVEDLIGKNIRDIITEENVALIPLHVRKTRTDGSCRFETTYVSRTGQRIVAEVNERPIEFGGKNAILSVARDITERKRTEEALQKSYLQLQRVLEGTVNALASIAEKRDPFTAGHQQRVTRLACAIAEEMNLSEEQRQGIRMAATVHDIGKISIPAEILNKPGQLTELQSSIIKTHPTIGYDILKEIEFPWPVAQIVFQHHERIDGTGYPQGLSHEEIMLEAKILAVADVVEAMASHRPYREAYKIKRALGEVSRRKGILFDPEVVEACSRVITEKEFTFT